VRDRDDLNHVVVVVVTVVALAVDDEVGAM